MPDFDGRMSGIFKLSRQENTNRTCACTLTSWSSFKLIDRRLFKTLVKRLEAGEGQGGGRPTAHDVSKERRSQIEHQRSTRTRDTATTFAEDASTFLTRRADSPAGLAFAIISASGLFRLAQAPLAADILTRQPSRAASAALMGFGAKAAFSWSSGKLREQRRFAIRFGMRRYLCEAASGACRRHYA